MKNETRDIQPPAVGSSSLLVAFALLCLTVFALLSLSTVQAEKRLSQSSAQAVENYYRADCQAETIFAQLRAGALPREVTLAQGVYRYSVPIGEELTLQVELTRAEDLWKVLRWQALAPERELVDGLPVWDGQ